MTAGVIPVNVPDAVCRKCGHRIVRNAETGGWGTPDRVIRGCAHIPSAESLRTPGPGSTPDLAADRGSGSPTGASRDEVAARSRPPAVSPHGRRPDD